MKNVSGVFIQIFLLRPAISLSMFAQQQVRSESQGSAREENLKKFLRDYVVEHFKGSQDDQLWYFDAFVNLRGAGIEDAIVYFEGPRWCGSGGCPMLVVTPEKSTYRLVTKTTITRPPIRVLDTSSHGWRDIAVLVVGGGIIPGYEAVLRFDGKTYPTNPSMVPRTSGGKPAGQTVISGDDFEDRKPLLPAK